MNLKLPAASASSPNSRAHRDHPLVAREHPVQLDPHIEGPVLQAPLILSGPQAGLATINHHKALRLQVAQPVNIVSVKASLVLQDEAFRHTAAEFGVIASRRIAS